MPELALDWFADDVECSLGSKAGITDLCQWRVFPLDVYKGAK